MKVLLVDDELLVRTNIKLMLQAYSDHIAICGEASNGQEALGLISTCHPDVILSDMVMSPVNGLELCEKVHKDYPNIRFIALSNYDDFDLVRGTLKNGGIDYLLKHQLNPTFLYQVLSKLEPTIKKSTNDIVHNGNSIIALQKKFVLDLIGNMFITSKDIHYNLKTLSINVDTTKVRPILMRIDNYLHVTQNKETKRKHIIEFSVTNIGNEILGQYHSGILTHLENEYYCILISFETIYSEAEMAEITNSTIRQLSSNLKTYLNIITSYSIGEICNNIVDIPEAYETARLNLKNTFYTGNASILRNDSCYPIMKDSLQGLSLNTERELTASIDTLDIDQMQYIIHSIFGNILDQHLSLKNAQMIFSDLIGFVIRISKKKGIPLDSIFNDDFSPFELLSHMSSINQVRSWFLEIYSNLYKQLETQLSGDSVYVKNAISYINTNYSKPISLQIVSDEIGISSGYLSTIFKKETEQGFNDYLNSLRISMSTKMIDYGEIDLHRISTQCGFQDYAYFFRVFKKKMNMTPTEFKNK